MGELDPRIRIRAPLRCDGIGRLDCAEDTVSGDRLAVRWLPLEANGDAAVRACENLPSHHALPRILQTGHVGASAFVALDFPDGEMLSARGEERLDNELLLKLAAQLSDALATVHAQGVVHGEMSRDSVLMVPGGRASLWDMPLVIANRLSDRRGENRLMQNLVKTAPYLSPERARGEGASQAGDVYALGAILCISAGAPLPTASTTLGVVHLVSAGLWAPRVPSSLPERWAKMLSRMVSNDAADRPSSAEVALAFSHVPTQNSLPTVPEMQAVRLPPEILAAANAVMRAQLEAMRAPTREMSLAQVEAATQEARAHLPMATDPMPELALKSGPARSVQAHTLDEVSEPGPDVVRIPTVEIEAVRAVVERAAPVVAAPVAHSVAINDSLSLSPDLLADGVMTLSADEVEAIAANTRRVWMVFGGVVGAALALIGVVVMLATRPSEVIAAPVQPTRVVKPLVARALPSTVVSPLPRSEGLDELTPLPRLTSKKARREPALVEARSLPVVVTPPAPAPVAEKSPVDSARSDFNFLEGAEAPRSELKRPSTEM